MSPRYAWTQFRHAFEMTVTIQLPEIGPEDIDADGKRIRLDTWATWSSARFAVEVTTTEAVPDGIGDVQAFALISSPRSNARIPAKLVRDPSSTKFTGTLDLDRELLAGPVTVSGEIVAYGDWGVRAVGSSEPWTIVVDASAAPTPPGAPPFDIIWIEFPSPEAPTQAQAAQASYALMDTSGAKPVLYLNRAVDGLESILSAARPRDEKKRLRDVLGAQVAHYAATTLFNEAVLECDVTDDIVTRPGDTILSQILDAVSGEIDNVQDTDEMVIALKSDGATRHDLRTQVDNALMTLTHFSGHVARSVEAVSRG